MSNENLSLQQLLCKILNKSIIDKFHNELQKNNIRDSNLSIKSGKNPSAFNKTFNNAEQLTLSSFLRYLYAAADISNSAMNSKPFALDTFLQDEDIKILELICSIKDCTIDELDPDAIKFLKHLKYHFDFLQKNNKLTQNQICVYTKLYNKIN
ncbi:hypothetical protein LL037_08410 [Clostridium estertheticum]|uniref:hypothetical protein n=1 Tax=Clostridium estertheticum TaxID=238834 RepID=UPI001C0D35B3|nr:hypothetical protein [Clostridium estertheticum]MBU3201734.1 hypothetical protein [Clostridium estertheticum]WAG67136.1 hypothetical protein LL037_08410 [Clostridium estertheticum]